MRNPITGLGPAAYRPYARMEPLPYLDAFWVSPNVSSHNNYVDIFSHTGIIGLGLFIWFIVSYFSLALRVRSRQLSGLSAGYVNGVIAAVAGSLVIMLLADWILPFVYNISFQGFQASVLVWLMMGGVLALDHLSAQAVDQRIGVTERG
jgi:O-antigen ligase